MYNVVQNNNKIKQKKLHQQFNDSFDDNIVNAAYFESVILKIDISWINYSNYQNFSQQSDIRNGLMFIYNVTFMFFIDEMKLSL